MYMQAFTEYVLYGYSNLNNSCNNIHIFMLP